MTDRISDDDAKRFAKHFVREHGETMRRLGDEGEDASSNSAADIQGTCPTCGADAIASRGEWHATRNRVADILERIEGLHRAQMLTMANIRRCFEDAGEPTVTRGPDESAIPPLTEWDEI